MSTTHTTDSTHMPTRLDSIGVLAERLRCTVERIDAAARTLEIMPRVIINSVPHFSEDQALRIEAAVIERHRAAQAATIERR
ncbi:MAG: hypothetical protein ACOY3P_24515 [Planctomycetota bacterium]